MRRGAVAELASHGEKLPSRESANLNFSGWLLKNVNPGLQRGSPRHIFKFRVTKCKVAKEDPRRGRGGGEGDSTGADGKAG